MLYTLSRSPAQCDLAAMLDVVTAEDDILLVQDGVFVGVSENIYLPLLFNTLSGVYALRTDVEARGLIGYFSPKISIVGYTDFVALTVKHRQHIAW